MKIIDGELISKKIELDLRKQIVSLINQKKEVPGLAIILIGEDPASKLYVSIKKEACHKVGINYHDYLFPSDASEEEISMTIDYLNNDNAVNGILLQLPLPEKFEADKIISKINENKDVDGLKMDSQAVSPLILAIYEALASTGEDLKNKSILAIAKNDIFVKHLKSFFDKKELKIESIIPDNKNLADKTIQADIIISVVGKPQFIKKEMIKEDAILIDCGISQKGSKIVGDVDIKDVKKKAGWVTPVPKGIGPITVAMLLKNTIELFNKKNP